MPLPFFYASANTACWSYIMIISIRRLVNPPERFTTKRSYWMLKPHRYATTLTCINERRRLEQYDTQTDIALGKNICSEIYERGELNNSFMPCETTYQVATIWLRTNQTGSGNITHDPNARLTPDESQIASRILGLSRVSRATRNKCSKESSA